MSEADVETLRTYGFTDEPMILVIDARRQESEEIRC
jgi:hypothetical protein